MCTCLHSCFNSAQLSIFWETESAANTSDTFLTGVPPCQMHAQSPVLRTRLHGSIRLHQTKHLVDARNVLEGRARFSPADDIQDCATKDPAQITTSHQHSAEHAFRIDEACNLLQRPVTTAQSESKHLSCTSACASQSAVLTYFSSYNSRSCKEESRHSATLYSLRLTNHNGVASSNSYNHWLENTTLGCFGN